MELDEPPRALMTELPSSSWTSAMTTLAPCSEKSFAIASPIPLAPPVTIATFPSSLLPIVERNEAEAITFKAGSE